MVVVNCLEMCIQHAMDRETWSMGNDPVTIAGGKYQAKDGKELLWFTKEPMHVSQCTPDWLEVVIS